MTTTNGLSQHDLANFRDILIKSNVQNLMMLKGALKREIYMREKIYSMLEQNKFKPLKVEDVLEV